MALQGRAGLGRQHCGRPCRTLRSMLPNWSISLSHGQRKCQLQRYQRAGTCQPRGLEGVGGSLLVPVGTLGMHCHPYPMLRMGARSPEPQWWAAHRFGSPPGPWWAPHVRGVFMKVSPLPGCPHPSRPLCRRPQMGRRCWWCWTPRGAMPSTLASPCCHPYTSSRRPCSTSMSLQSIRKGLRWAREKLSPSELIMRVFSPGQEASMPWCLHCQPWGDMSHGGVSGVWHICLCLF